MFSMFGIDLFGLHSRITYNSKGQLQLRDEGSDRVLVLDASPSMLEEDWQPSRLAGEQKAARAYLKRVLREDPYASVAVVEYNSQARMVCGLTPVATPSVIRRAIRQLEVDNCTNITAGLKQALNLLKGCSRPAQVVLLTDGNHNTGSDPRPVAAKLKKVATIECVGIGDPDDIDSDLLKEIASRYPDGRPRYRWIGDPEELVEQFKSLGGRISRS